MEKTKFLASCVATILNSHSHLPQSFLSLLRQHLGEELWLENCNEKNISRNESDLTVGARTIKGFQGDLGSLSDVFEDSLRVFHLSGGKYVLLETITQLQTVVSEIVASTARQFKKTHNLPRSPAALAQTVQSYEFRIQVSNFCARQIKCSGISGKHLNKADLLIMKQTGGAEQDVLQLVYDVSVSTQKIAYSWSPYYFLEKLLENLQKFDAHLLKKSPKVLISTTGHHVWTVTPHCWSLLIENKKKFHHFIREAVFDPAKARLSTPIPQETKKRVVERYTQDEALRTSILESTHQKVVSYAYFRAEFLSQVSADKVKEADEFIDQEFSKVLLTKQDLSRILHELRIIVNSSIFFDLHKKLPTAASYPFQFARALRLNLIDKGIAILQPYEIEQVICRVLGLPLNIEAGDLNWVHDNREDPYHLHLVIRYNWVIGTPNYYVRHQEKESLESGSKYHTFNLRHPKSVMHPEFW